MAKWSYVEHPLVGLCGNKQWYLVSSPERPIGYVSNEENAKLIAATPEMYTMLKECLELIEELHELAYDRFWPIPKMYYHQVDKANALLSRINFTEAAATDNEHE